jgi:hypothetical protein
MTITTGGYTFDYDRRVEPGALPVTLTYRGNAVMGVFLLVFSVFWFAMVLLIAQALFAEPFPVNLVPLVFVVPAAGLFIVGLRAMLMRSEVTFAHDGVSVAQRHWFAFVRHSVALKDYPGVLRARVSYSRNKKSYVAWLAVLPHENRALRVVLAASRDEAEGRRLVEDYARWLDLPALEESIDGFDARAPGELDTPLAQRIATGSASSSYRPGGPVPAQVRVEQGADSIVVSLLKGAMPLWLAAVAGGLGAAIAFVFIGWGGDPGAQIFGGAVGLIVLGGTLWLAFSGLRTTRQIIVTRDRVALATLAKSSGETKVEHDMAHDEIEALRLARGPMGGAVLWFDTDRGSFQTGANMPRAALAYVRDLVAAALATADDKPSQEAP